MITETRNSGFILRDGRYPRTRRTSDAGILGPPSDIRASRNRRGENIVTGLRIDGCVRS